METFFDYESATMRQISVGGASPELIFRGRHALLIFTSLLAQTADDATEEGTELLFHRLAFGYPILPLDQALRELSPQIGRILRPIGITALFLAHGAESSDSGVPPVLAYVSEGRMPLPFGGYLEAARIGAITGQEFRWEPRFAENQDRFPSATAMWTRRG